MAADARRSRVGNGGVSKVPTVHRQERPLVVLLSVSLISHLDNL
jgi:hypothetical protein